MYWGYFNNYNLRFHKIVAESIPLFGFIAEFEQFLQGSLLKIHNFFEIIYFYLGQQIEYFFKVIIK